MELLFYIVGGLWLLAAIGFCMIYIAASKGANVPYDGCSCVACDYSRSEYEDTH